LTQAILPFSNQQESGTEELAGASPIAMNVVIDGKGAVKRRPGIGAYRGAVQDIIDASGIAGVYVTDGGDLYAVSAHKPDAHIYAVTAAATRDISLAPASFVRGAGRPIFAETEMLLLIAAGSDIQKVELATRTSSLLGGNPPNASFVVANNSRLLANDTTVDLTKVRYSDVAIGKTDFSGHESWDIAVGSSAGFFTAEARPDPVVAMYESTNEVFVWGSDTLQIFDPDPTFIYAPGPTREVGCAAPYSVIKREQQFYWLDHKLRLVNSDGRSLNAIGGPIKSDIDAMAIASQVKDCFGYHVHHGSTDALVWTFPTDGRTYVYQTGSGWGQWSSWQDGLDNWAPFTVLSHHLVNGTNENVVGLADGRIGLLSSSSSTDLGVRINAYVVTGFQEHGTDALKWCKIVRLAFRRGEADGEPKGFLSWRDDLGAWSSPLEVSLGARGESDPVVIFRALGTYRRRQWRFQFDGPAELVLVAATEEYEVLAN
jgi:hypothetical protein